MTTNKVFTFFLVEHAIIQNFQANFGVRINNAVDGRLDIPGLDSIFKAVYGTVAQKSISVRTVKLSDYFICNI